MAPTTLRASARGTSMVDVIVAVALLSILMAASYGSLAMQLRTFGTQAMMSQSMNEARVAFQVMTDQVAMAGFGVPSATVPAATTKLVTATTTQLSFWTRVDAGHTYLSVAAPANASAVTVVSAAGLAAGTSVYITDTNRWYFGSVQQVSGTTVRLTPRLTYDFSAGSPLIPVERVTFEVLGNELRRNGHRFIDHVTDLTFAYDSATLSAIRRITMQLTVQTPAVDPATRQRQSVALTTQVTPPNLGL